MEKIVIIGGDIKAAISGGHTSLKINLLPIGAKSIEGKEAEESAMAATQPSDLDTPVIVDVRTPEEFHSGAYPGAVNIPLDELPHRYEELGDITSRDITLYCASGARSSYAQKILMQIGYTNVKNGGGIMQMMMRR